MSLPWSRSAATPKRREPGGNWASIVAQAMPAKSAVLEYPLARVKYEYGGAS